MQPGSLSMFGIDHLILEESIQDLKMKAPSIHDSCWLLSERRISHLVYSMKKARSKVFNLNVFVQGLSLMPWKIMKLPMRKAQQIKGGFVRPQMPDTSARLIRTHLIVIAAGFVCRSAMHSLAVDKLLPNN
ncbi:unnamed protein product [Cylicocyclus nassatus]|uniref:Uncharacterized protein n=1 Tax=Cylicocyclus nassatus TaxID=53992 RepID=A0AA36H345_CYLNA|nr:unnamed protein product [Cylicocyclus nassatus]